MVSGDLAGASELGLSSAPGTRSGLGTTAAGSMCTIRVGSTGETGTGVRGAAGALVTMVRAWGGSGLGKTGAGSIKSGLACTE
jgi:hypothetical protein